MKTTEIDNSCLKRYKPDPEKIIRRIIDRIPDKFLAGLDIIVLKDGFNSSTPRMEYFFNKVGSGSKIEINMDYDEYSRIPLFSLLSLNMDFLLKVNEHIERSLKPKSEDDDILKNDPSRLNLKWGYFGIWSPIKAVFIILSRISVIRNFALIRAQKIINK